MREYVDINTIYPKFKNIGDFFITKRKNNSPISNFIIEHYKEKVVMSDELTVLTNKSGDVVMSNDNVELLSNNQFIQNAHGDVLIFGLGLGLIIFPLLKEQSVKSITVVEKQQQIIDYVGKIVKEKDLENKVSIICSDVLTYSKNIPNRRFDYIYFDIWNTLNKESFDEMEYFHKIYEPIKKSASSTMHSWGYELKELIINQSNNSFLYYQ